MFILLHLFTFYSGRSLWLPVLSDRFEVCSIVILRLCFAASQIYTDSNLICVHDVRPDVRFDRIICSRAF